MSNANTDHCWIDCDPGLDDTFALLLASFTNTIKIIGITTVSGNNTIENVTNNTLTVLNLFGQVNQEAARTDEEDMNSCSIHNALKFPLLKGCSKPLLNQLNITDVHGESGLSTLNPVDIPEIEPHVREHVDNFSKTGFHFTTLMYNQFKTAEKPVTVIALGPLTNIALLLINHPDAAQFIGKIVLMGGAIGTGNSNPVAEFNIHTDPQAASFVFDSGIPIYMVPLDVTRTVPITTEVIESVGSVRSKFSNILVEFFKYYDFMCNKSFGIPAYLHDPCAVAFVIDPGMFEYKLMRVDVETSSELSFGQTVCDIFGKSPKSPNVHVCTKMDVAKFWSMIVDAIRKCDRVSPANR
jgi:inosine-uridine nucleoside N-ribohydrolase